MQVRASLTAGEVSFWNRPLASLSLQIASMVSKHHGKNNGGPNQWIVRLKITTRLLKIHLSLSLSLFSLRAAEFWQVTCKQMA